MEKLKYNDDKISYLRSCENYDLETFAKGRKLTQFECEQLDYKMHGVVFPQRYNKGEIKFHKTYKDYLNNLNIQLSIEALGLDKEKFWYFILYAYDLSEQKTKNIEVINDSAKTQYRNFIDTLDSAFELDENKQFIYDKFGFAKLLKDVVIEIKIDGKKQKAVIDNVYGLEKLSNLMDEYLYMLEDNTKFDIKPFAKEYKNEFGACSYLVITYFKRLFEYLKNDLKKGKTDLYNKNLLITEVLYFMRLIKESQKDQNDYIKDTIKYYKTKIISKPLFACQYY